MFVTGGDKDMSTGDRIRARREQLGMTQDELAHKLGYKSRSSVNKIELGKQELTQKKIRVAAEVLGVTASYLLELDNRIDISVTPHERRVIEQYRSASGRDKKLVDSILEVWETS